jgi:hypothetical protein
VPFQRDGDSFALNGRRQAVTKSFDAVQNVLLDAKFFKRPQFSFFGLLDGGGIVVRVFVATELHRREGRNDGGGHGLGVWGTAKVVVGAVRKRLMWVVLGRKTAKVVVGAVWKRLMWVVCGWKDREREVVTLVGVAGKMEISRGFEDRAFDMP